MQSRSAGALTMPMPGLGTVLMPGTGPMPGTEAMPGAAAPGAMPKAGKSKLVGGVMGCSFES